MSAPGLTAASRTHAPPDRALPLSWLLLAAAAVAVRLVAVTAPPHPDEVGYLLVAASARPHGPFLYGDLWVDRPPLLVAMFAVAGALTPVVGDPVLAVRLLAAAGLGAAVLAACAAGRRLGGSRGAAVAGVVTGALGTSPLLGAPAADGEVMALPLVLLAVAVALRVLRPTGAAPWRTTAGEVVTMAGAGLLAGAAVLVKQNIADAGVFVVACVLAAGLRGALPWRRALALLAATAAGAGLAAGAALAWAAAWGTGPAGVYDALVGFRAASLDVIADRSVATPVRRAGLLAGAAVLSGLVPLLALLLLRVVRGWRAPDPVGLALVAVLGWGLFSVAAGGSYWRHYLVERVPVAALGAAWLVGTTGRGAPVSRERRAGRRTLAAVPFLVALVAASSLVTTGVVASTAGPALSRAGCLPGVRAGEGVATWLRARTAPGDSAVTVYGGVSALAGTGLEPAYPYLWSLPVRTLDPGLDRLDAAVSGPGRATWVVRGPSLRSFGLDADGQLADALSAGYGQVHQVCGIRVLLRDDVVRPSR